MFMDELVDTIMDIIEIEGELARIDYFKVTGQYDKLTKCPLCGSAAFFCDIVLCPKCKQLELVIDLANTRGIDVSV